MVTKSPKKDLMITKSPKNLQKLEAKIKKWKRVESGGMGSTESSRINEVEI